MEPPTEDPRAQDAAQGEEDHGRLLDEHFRRARGSTCDDVRRCTGRIGFASCHPSHLSKLFSFIQSWELFDFTLARIRLCDKSTVDVTQLRSALDGFMKKVSALFLQRKAGIIHSYTRHVSWKVVHAKFIDSCLIELS